MGIGNKLTKLMKEQSTNANELAIKANVPPTTIYSLIKRDSNRVDIDSLIRIARALGVTAEYFCNENISEELPSISTPFTNFEYQKNNFEINQQKSFKSKLIEGIEKLDKNDWEELERIISKVTNPKEEEIDYYEEAPKTPEELRQKYIVENINNSKIS